MTAVAMTLERKICQREDSEIIYLQKRFIPLSNCHFQFSQRFCVAHG
jgi:hypothetical protein